MRPTAFARVGLRSGIHDAALAEDGLGFRVKGYPNIGALRIRPGFLLSKLLYNGLRCVRVRSRHNH